MEEPADQQETPTSSTPPPPQTEAQIDKGESRHEGESGEAIQENRQQEDNQDREANISENGQLSQRQITGPLEKDEKFTRFYKTNCTEHQLQILFSEEAKAEIAQNLQYSPGAVLKSPLNSPVASTSESRDTNTRTSSGAEDRRNFSRGSGVNNNSPSQTISSLATPSLTPPTQRKSRAEMFRQSTLPTGSGFAPAPIPQYITSEQQQSGDSTGSQDSVRTQVPLPYHLPQNHIANNNGNGNGNGNGGDNYTYTTMTSTGQIGRVSGPWGTPDMSGSATFTNHGSGASRSAYSLNPNSAEYVPSPGYPPASQGYGGYGQNNSIVSPSPFQQSAQIGGFSSYQPVNSYGQSQYGGAQLQNPLYSNSSTMSPYGNFGSGGMNGYNNGYNAGGGLQPNPLAAPFAPSNHGSPGMNQASMAPVGSAYLPPYGPGIGAGIHSSNNYGQAQHVYTGAGSNQGWSNFYTPPANVPYRATANDPIYANPSNAQRGKPAHSKARNGNLGNGHGHTSSNLATAPVLSAVGSQNGKVTSTRTQKFGGPVIPPSMAARSSTPSMSAVESSKAASPDRRTLVNSDAAPTPGQKNQPLDLEFSSEPRNTATPRAAATPTLRSRRGQTITAVTDPAKKQSVVNWLDKTPSMGNSGVQGSNLQSQSPPKMLALLSSLDATPKALTTINENDPFTGPARPRAATSYNPFAPKPALPAPYDGGNSLVGRRTGPSPHLRALTSDCTRRPSFEEALDSNNFPFVEFCRVAKDNNEFGVIRIKNIPYGVTRPEILAFLGRNARIVNEQQFEPVHIVMERVTSKTLDCYVEFINLNEAVNAVNRFETNRTGGRGGRLGARHVEVELASQEQLMHDLFPKAKNVQWQGSRPIILPTDPNDRYNSGFAGFISKEELVMLVKHVETPQRSPFSKECPQRPFECLISTLLKYPWYMVDHITIEDRALLHKATMDLLELLRERIESETDPVNLNQMLYKRVWRAALKCAGFTQVQKDDIAFICHVDDLTARELGLGPYAVWWKQLYTIGPKSNLPDDTIMWYCAIIREHLNSKKQHLSLAERSARGEENALPKLFGDLDKLIERPSGWYCYTLRQVAEYEWAAIEQVLREALIPALEGRK